MIGLLEDISCGDQGDKNLTDLIKTIFEPGGLLEKTLDFEHRPEQASMAEVFLNSLAVSYTHLTLPTIVSV